MVGRQFGADVERRVVGDAELDDLRLGLDFGLAESATLRLRNILRLRRAGTELNGHIAVAFLLAHGDELTAFEAKDGDGHRPDEHTSELQSLKRTEHTVYSQK